MHIGKRYSKNGSLDDALVGSLTEVRPIALAQDQYLNSTPTGSLADAVDSFLSENFLFSICVR